MSGVSGFKFDGTTGELVLTDNVGSEIARHKQIERIESANPRSYFIVLEGNRVAEVSPKDPGSAPQEGCFENKAHTMSMRVIETENPLEYVRQANLPFLLASKDTSSSLNPPESSTPLPEDLHGFFQTSIIELAKAMNQVLKEELQARLDAAAPDEDKAALTEQFNKTNGIGIPIISEYGICFGFAISSSMMAGLSGDSKDIGSLAQRLNLLPKSPMEDFGHPSEDFLTKTLELAREIRATEVKLRNTLVDSTSAPLTPHEKELLDLQTWVTNLCFIQSADDPEQVKIAPNRQTSQSASAHQELMSIFLPASLDTKSINSSEKYLNKFSSNKDMSIWLKKIEDASTKQAEPVALLIRFNGHAIAINYNPHSQSWMISDAHNGLLHFTNHQALIEAIQNFTFQTQPSADPTFFKVNAFGAFSTDQLNDLAVASWGEPSIEGSHSKILTRQLLAEVHAEKPNLELISTLIAAGADQNFQSYFEMNSLLHTAVTKKNTDLITLLLSLGANPTCKNKKGMTPLELAQAPENTESKKAILNYQLTTAIQNKYGMETIKSLLEQGADPNIKNKFGMTLLHIAALRKNVDLIKLAVSFKADINATNAHGLTPLEMATQSGAETAIIEALNISGIPALSSASPETSTPPYSSVSSASISPTPSSTLSPDSPRSSLLFLPAHADSSSPVPRPPDSPSPSHSS